MASISDLKATLTLTLDELKELVALLNLARESFPDGHHPELIDEVSDMYFELMEQLDDGIFEGFEPEEV